MPPNGAGLRGGLVLGPPLAGQPPPVAIRPPGIRRQKRRESKIIAF
jgi:hypothetical protein